MDDKYYSKVSNVSDGGASKRLCVKTWALEAFKACKHIFALLPSEERSKRSKPTMEHALNFKCSGGSNLFYRGAAKPVLNFLKLASTDPKTRAVFEDLLPDVRNREAGALTDSVAMFGAKRVSIASF